MTVCIFNCFNAGWQIFYMLTLVFVSFNRVYTLIHVLAYRGTEKDYTEIDTVSNLFFFTLLKQCIFQMYDFIWYGPIIFVFFF